MRTGMVFSTALAVSTGTGAPLLATSFGEQPATNINPTQIAGAKIIFLTFILAAMI